MQLAEMREKVRAELSRIPDWPEDHQSALRMMYWSLRMHSLGKKAKEKKTAFDVLQDCVRFIQERHPDYKPLYDREFFEKEGGRR